MALNCDIKQQLFTFNGKEYSYNQFRALMLDGLMEVIESGGTALVSGMGTAGNEIDVASIDAINELLDRIKGNNLSGVSKERIIRQLMNALNSMTASGFAYNAETGEGDRLFVVENNADYAETVRGRDGKSSLSRGTVLPRMDANGKIIGHDIYINLDAASAYTVGHEVTHVYLYRAFENNPELLENFRKHIQNIAQKADLGYLIQFANRYEGKLRAEEFLAELGGMLSSQIESGEVTAKDMSAYEKIISYINGIVSKLTKGRFGGVTNVKNKDVVMEFFESIAGAVANGEAFNAMLAGKAKEKVTSKTEEDAVQERTTEEVGAQPLGAEGAREEGGEGMGPGVQGPEAPQAGGPQGQVTPPTAEQKNDDVRNGRIARFTYGSVDEVPDVFKDRITRVGKTEKDGKGKREVEVSMSQSEADYLLQKAALTAEGPVSPGARESKIGEYVDSNGNKVTEDKVKYSIIHSFSDRVTGFTWEYLSSSKEFEALKKSGQITDDRTLNDFVGKYVFGHSPDAAFTGIIKKKDSNGNWVILVEGKGGIFYPIRHIEDLFVWASTASAANSMARQLNENAKKNGGPIYLALISAPEDKLLSSTTSSNGVIDIFKAMSNDVEGFGIPKNVFKSAMLKAAKAKQVNATGKTVGLGLKNLTQANTIEEIESEVRKKLAADASIFDDRKTFSLEFIRAFAEAISGTKAEKKVAEFILQGFQVKGYKQRGKIGETGKEKYRLSPTNMVSAISQMMGEPMLRGESSKKVYAIIEVTPNPKGVDSPSVEPFDSDLHESYPKAIKLAGEGMEVKVHILKDRELWTDRFEDPETGALVTPDREKKLFPTSGVTTTSLKVLPKKKAPEAKESKISGFVSAPTGTQAMPSSTLGITPDITAKESKIVAAFDQTGFVSVQSWVDALINDREYLNSVLASILESREILKRGDVREEAVVAAYLITIGSIGSQGQTYKNWKEGGKTIDPIFIEQNNGREWVRPEGAAAAYLTTEKGKKLVSDIVKGTAKKKQVADMFLFIGMGRPNQKTRDIMNTIRKGGIKNMTDLFNENKGSDFNKLYDGAIKFLSGIAEGKTGFFNQYFGVSSRAVLDAREWNAWIAGTMKLTEEQAKRRAKYEKSPKIQQMLLDRIEQVGLALGYSKDIAGYIAHHAIWDGVKGTITTHAGEYAVIKKYQGPKKEAKESKIGPAEKLPSSIDVDYILRTTQNSDGSQLYKDKRGVENFWRWFGNSEAVDEYKRPQVWLHGTARAFDVFEPKQAKAIFLTKDEQFAWSFARMSADWMAARPFLFFNESELKEQYQKARDEAKKVYLEYQEYLKFNKEYQAKQEELRNQYGDKWRVNMTKQQAEEYYKLVEREAEYEEIVDKAENFLVSSKDDYDIIIDTINEAEKQSLKGIKTSVVPDVFSAIVVDAMPSKPMTLRLYAKADNIFDFENPDDIQRISDKMPEGLDQSERIRISNGEWVIIESEKIQDAIKKAGFDSFYVQEGGFKNLAVYQSSQIKSASDNNGAFGIDIPRFKEQKIPTEKEIKESAHEDAAEYLTIVARRLNSEAIRGREFEKDVLETFGKLKAGDYREAIDKAEELFAQQIFNPVITSKPPVDQAKDLVEFARSIEHPVVKRWLSHRMQSFIHGMGQSKKLSKKTRRELENISGRLVIEIAQQGRLTGQENAASGEFYEFDKMFHFLVTAKEKEIDMIVELQTAKDPETGKLLVDIIDEQREEIRKLMEQMAELNELSELADEVNEVAMEDHTDAVLAGKETYLDLPEMVTAAELIEQKNKYEELLKKLQDGIDDLTHKLALVTRLYSMEKGRRQHYGQMISDLRADLEKRQKLYEKLKKSNAKLSSQNAQLRDQVKKLREKVKDLKELTRLLAKNKLSPNRQAKLKQRLVDLAAAGKLDDPDFAAVFAEIAGIAVLDSRDKAMIKHMAEALKYFEKNQHSEISQRYIQKFNDYLEAISEEKWTAYRFGMLFHGLLYASALSGFGTQLTATVGSILAGVTEGSALTIANTLTNPRTALGSFLYGMRRVWKEKGAAFSKGLYAQRAYDNLGVSWSGDAINGGADIASVHILEGYARQLSRVRNRPDLAGKAKSSIALAGAVVYLTTRISYIMRFIDPVMTHSLSAYQQGMMEYQKAYKELKAKGAGKMDVLEYWLPAISPKRWERIDKMSRYAEADRTNAAAEANREVAEMKAKGIEVPKDYARRRTSEIIRERAIGKAAKNLDILSRHALMMWNPDGAIGNIWDYIKGKLALKKSDQRAAVMLKSIAAGTVFMFLRITGASVSAAQSGIPLVGAGLAMWGWRKGEDGWGFGKKYEGGLRELPWTMRDPSNVKSRIAATRIGVNIMTTSIIMGVFMEMFEWYGDDEPEDKTGAIKIPVLGWYKLDPNRRIDITASGTGERPTAQEREEGRLNFAFKTRSSAQEEWINWTGTRLIPHFTFATAMLGRMADDAKGVYFDPKGLKTGKPADLSQYMNEYMIGLGEFSFNTIGRAWATAQYDKMKALADIFFRPITTIAQPAAIRDAILTAEDLMNVPKTRLDMQEGGIAATKNAFMSLYGFDQMMSEVATDQFGRPIQTINPISNWITYIDGEKKKSEQSPEWNLVYRYTNTDMPSLRRFSVETVNRAKVVGEDLFELTSDERKVMSDFEKIIDLTPDEMRIASDYVKAKFRNKVLSQYDQISEEAKERMKPLEGKIEDPGEYMTNKLEDILSEARDEVKNDMMIVANTQNNNKKQQITNMILLDIKKNQEESDKMSSDILKRGPLPKTGIGPDAYTRAKLIFD